MRGWGIEERRQSDVSAYSRAKERIVTSWTRKNQCPITQTGNYLMRCQHMSVAVKNLVRVGEERAMLGHAVQCHMYVVV